MGPTRACWFSGVTKFSSSCFSLHSLLRFVNFINVQFMLHSLVCQWWRLMWDMFCKVHLNSIAQFQISTLLISSCQLFFALSSLSEQKTQFSLRCVRPQNTHAPTFRFPSWCVLTLRLDCRSYYIHDRGNHEDVMCATWHLPPDTLFDQPFLLFFLDIWWE